MKQFKMLRKEGKGMPFHFTEALYARRDMKIVYMTKAEIDTMVGKFARTPERPDRIEEIDESVSEPAEELEAAEAVPAAPIPAKKLNALAAANLARRRKAEAAAMLQKAEDRKAKDAEAQKAEENDPLA